MSWKPVEQKKYIKYKCPQCSNSISSILGDKAQYIVCKKCNNLFHNNTGQLTFIAHFKKTFNPIFQIGTTGEYRKKKFQLIGVIQVKEDKTTYYWDEYIIKYEDETIAYFMQYDGHWSYVEQLPHPIKATKGGDIFYEEEQYTYFNSYKSVNICAEGDFLWNITDREKPRINEYINPPYGLVAEHKKTQISWYKSEYIHASKMRIIFDVDRNHWLPQRTGVYSIQPAPFPVKSNVLTRIGFLYAVLITAISILLTFVNNETKVFDMKQPLNQSSFELTAPGDSSIGTISRQSEILDHGVYYPDSNTFISEPFKITSQFNSTAVDVTLYAPVSNNWFEASCQMINESSGQEYFFEIGTEYYFGDGWTEGSTENNITLSQIPDGNYRIIIKPFAGKEGLQVTDYRITITEGTTLWSNFFILLLVGLSIPIGMIVYINNFNASRWYNSNLSQ
jgi:ribosomal protein L37AE/L43A